jgi:hypothetical protein
VSATIEVLRMSTWDKVKASAIGFVNWIKEWPPRIALIVGAIIIIALLLSLTGCMYANVPEVADAQSPEAFTDPSSTEDFTMESFMCPTDYDETV